MEFYQLDAIDKRLVEVITALKELSAEVNELWKRVERLEHPAIAIKADYPHRNRGDFDD